MAPSSLNVGEQDRFKDCYLFNNDSLWQPGCGFSSPAVALLGSIFFYLLLRIYLQYLDHS